MAKPDIGQIFRRNLEQAMERAGINQQNLAPKAGMSVGHLSEVRRGLVSPTLGLLGDLAHALGIEPWELLADSETTKRNALAKLLWSGDAPDKAVAEHFGPAPHVPEKKAPLKKTPAPRRRRTRPKNDGHQASG